ncbi:MAG: hypothetical protein JSU82_17310 [Rhodospirillales bacterium]|nr:MAG: hypothetical protein JSU82_17310 [Rhodospirillales bacterium]
MTGWQRSLATSPAAAAQALAEADAALPLAPAFRAMPPTERDDLRTKLARVRSALMAEPQSLARPADPYDTDILARPMLGPTTGYGGFDGPGASQPVPQAPPAEPAEPKSLLRTVRDLPAAAGAMADELDFASFVASLVHGTFDAIVDSSIRQMEAFASLVSSLSRTVEDFSRDNVTANQVRDWLVENHPGDLQLILPTAEGQQPRVLPRTAEDDWGASPSWLADYDLAGEELSEELIETRIIPTARIRLGEERMRSLASMALMGLHRVRVERGEINARVRIRAKASDTARVGFAQDQDGGAAQGGWSGRAGFSPPAAQAMISTAVNAQSDAAIAAELQGEVRIVFVSDAVPLESFVSDAQRVLLERTARTRGAPGRQAQAAERIGRDAVADTLSPQNPPSPAPPAPPATAEPVAQAPQGGDTG